MEKRIEVVAGTAGWVVQDCGIVFKKGADFNNLQFEANQPIIFESNTKTKILKQFHLNRYHFVGEIEAIMVDLISLDVVKDAESKFLKDDFNFEEYLEDWRKKGYGPRTVVQEIIVDCGFPIRFNYGNEGNIQFLNNWGWGHRIDKLRPGLFVAGEMALHFLTCVDAGILRKTVDCKVLNIYEIIKDPLNQNFGEVIELEDSGNPFKLDKDDLLVRLGINNIGRFIRDPNCEILTK
ncbi:MAG: hypothetical protein O8C66_16130 [Candidatus Methanoperedens sp.]|nr:hypothetical protein [Candidatus Methanoperedens sp.]MCZ7372024.1 hypothetical protein [Candidatus Methanoperedens sp.]